MRLEAYYYWREQCAAAASLRERFGVYTALDYLVCDKLLGHTRRAESEAGYAHTLPDFAGRVRSMFEPHLLRDYLDSAKQNYKAEDRVRIKRIRAMLLA